MKYGVDISHRFAIFDMDGTIIDSMPAWKNLWSDYLISKGVQPPKDLIESIRNMTLGESSQYFIERFGIKSTKEDVKSEFYKIMEKKYYVGFPPKPGIIEYVSELRSNGVLTCVVTATAEKLARACLKQNNMIGLFDFVISCEKVGKNKQFPDAYNLASYQFGSKPSETVVFEDAQYAATTAVKAGYYTIGVFDEYYMNCIDAMKSICNDYIYSFKRDINTNSSERIIDSL